MSEPILTNHSRNWQDLTGRLFKKMTVIRESASQGKRAVWTCRCACGNERDIKAVDLNRERFGKCQCERFDTLKKLESHIGLKYHKLTVLSLDLVRPPVFRCLCECGNEIRATSYSVIGGNTKSCGCLINEVLLKRNFKHGLYVRGNVHPIRHAYGGMMSRCFNEHDRRYRLYGGRGITVCQEWMDFLVFKDDMLPTWTKGLSLDRIDVNGNYKKSNCRWTTQKVQCNNKRNNIWLEFKGLRMTVSQWAEHLGINSRLIYDRLRLGLTIERCLFVGKFKQTKQAEALGSCS